MSIRELYIYDDRQKPVESRSGHHEGQYQTGEEYSECVTHDE
jgi:hypothetical protein